MRRHLFILSFLFLSVFVVNTASANDFKKKNINLKCESESFFGEAWGGNIIFVKIRPKKNRAYTEDMGDQIGWVIFKIMQYGDDYIVIANCRDENCSTDQVGNYLIDRVSGRMTMTTDRNPLATWICEPISGF